METIKHYKKGSITIVWQAEKCIHCGNCAKGLSSVFKPKEKPWVQPENATEEEIINQIKNCPSGALSVI